jgi:hypothetical protein
MDYMIYILILGIRIPDPIEFGSYPDPDPIHWCKEMK